MVNVADMMIRMTNGFGIYTPFPSVCRAYNNIMVVDGGTFLDIMLAFFPLKG
uniref:Uncharacterized protein n=1 Tax=Medicago truncatula TaxID=3880 RepID=A2Q4G5_MEDTR|nr:hypothetical protein MtrDRAFT_AC157473g39v2 [Medicago truncatula]